MPTDAQPSARGTLVIIGGAEDKLGQKSILTRFTKLAGGPDARIAVLSTASSLGDVATQVYRALFAGLGVGDVRGLRPLTREDADDEAVAAAVADATGVFMTGGNQVKLSAVVAGTRLGEAIHAAYERGAVIGGTSAGASAMSAHMVAYGAGGNTPKHRMTQLCAGLGLLPGVIVDQHFDQRGRIGRLLMLVAQSPSLLGIGVDEDTAAIVSPDGVMEVLGRGAVTVVDGHRVASNAFEAKRTQAVLVSGAVLHSVPPGFSFDLATRQLVNWPPADATPPVVDKTPEPRAMARAIAAEGADDRAPERSARRRRSASSPEPATKGKRPPRPVSPIPTRRATPVTIDEQEHS